MYVKVLKQDNSIARIEHALWQGQRSNQYHTVMLHTYNP